MGLVDYSDDESSDGEITPRILGPGLKKDFDGIIKPAACNVEIKKVEITPGGKKFKEEKDLAVLAALATADSQGPPKSPVKVSKPLKRKLDIDLAPEIPNKRPDLEPLQHSLETSYEPEFNVVHAVGGGRHQLSSLIRNAVDNKAALQAQFNREKQARQARGKKYGF